MAEATNPRHITSVSLANVSNSEGVSERVGTGERGYHTFQSKKYSPQWATKSDGDPSRSSRSQELSFLGYADMSNLPTVNRFTDHYLRYI